jgi:hypothetical protein
MGAIVATILAHTLRLAAYLILGARRAPVPYQFIAILFMAATAGVAIWFVSDAPPGQRILIIAGALGVLGATSLLACAHERLFPQQAPALRSGGSAQ